MNILATLLCSGLCFLLIPIANKSQAQGSIEHNQYSYMLKEYNHIYSTFDYCSFTNFRSEKNDCELNKMCYISLRDNISSLINKYQNYNYRYIVYELREYEAFRAKVSRMLNVMDNYDEFCKNFPNVGRPFNRGKRQPLVLGGTKTTYPAPVPWVTHKGYFSNGCVEKIYSAFHKHRNTPLTEGRRLVIEAAGGDPDKKIVMSLGWFKSFSKDIRACEGIMEHWK